MKKMNINEFLEEIQKIGYIIEQDEDHINLLFDRSEFCTHYPMCIKGNNIVYLLSLRMKDKDICIGRTIYTDNLLDNDFSFKKVIKDLSKLMTEYKQLKVKNRKDQLETDFM